MPMSFQQLVRLFILQKNHLSDKTNEALEKAFDDEFARLLPANEFINEDRMAAPLFKDQPKIPFVLFAPKNASAQNPRQLIIQTHGGPHVYMDKENLHAEIAYFVSQGFVVACPNYRGSTGYPAIGDDPQGWKEWEARSKDKHHIYGPQDVFAVTKEVQKLPFVNRNKVILRGGSFGSKVNADLLAGVAAGIYEDIYKGAHLSGGVKYPVLPLMPNVSLLITHSIKDNIAPFGHARIFMEKILLNKLAYELEHDRPIGSIQTFISNTGNHHLIDPALQLNDTQSASYTDVIQYLTHSVGFVHSLSSGIPYQTIDSYEQLKKVIVQDSAGDLLQRIYDLTNGEDFTKWLKTAKEVIEDLVHYLHELTLNTKFMLALEPDTLIIEALLKNIQELAHSSEPWLNLEKKKVTELLQHLHVMTRGARFKDALQADKEISEDILQRLHAYKYVHNDKDTSKESIPTTAAYALKPTSQKVVAIAPKPPVFSLALSVAPDARKYYGPTMALLQLQLGRDFTGQPRTDLRTFLQHHFTPVSWGEMMAIIPDAGSRILKDKIFFEQMVTAIAKEESFLKQNPDYMVMYHAADNSTLQLYNFINLWQAILKDKAVNQLSVIQEMRLYNFMKESFEDIEAFLIKMRKRRQPDTLFNNQDGYNDVAIACNPSLISNAHCTASCTLWWYFATEQITTKAPFSHIIKELLKILGIYSPERMASYEQLFERSSQNLGKTPQALLQQVFIPKDLAKKSVYMCQIWGEEFTENSMSLASPAVITDLITNPELFERTLRENKNAFKNFGPFPDSNGCPGFGDTTKGFNYANSLQLRYLPRNSDSIVTNSYFRSWRHQQRSVAELSAWIKMDYADYLALGSALPDFIIPGAESAKENAYSHSSLSIFRPNNKANYLYKQQEQLYRGLVQNPRQEIYGCIVYASPAIKASLQLQLRACYGGESRHPVYPYSLCLYLKGYTYYDLLKEAAEGVLVNDTMERIEAGWLRDGFKKENPGYLTAFAKSKQLCQGHMDEFMDLISSFSIPGSIDSVVIDGTTCQTLTESLYRLRNYEFNSKKHSFIQGNLTNNNMMGLELGTAINIIIKHAQAAKKRDYGHDVTSFNSNVY